MRSTIRRTMARVAVGAAGATLLLTSSGGLAFAHTQTVTPPGQDATVEGPISNSWAQAHCNSSAPAVVGEASDGVVVFNPPEPKSCEGFVNPGGQEHP